MDHTRDTAGGRRGLWETIKACSGTAIDRRNQYRILAWTFVSAVAFIGAAWALRPEHGLDGAAAWAVALAPIVLGVPALLAYLRFLRMTDELLRQIQLEGLAVGFAAGAVVGLAYPTLELAGAPPQPSSTVVVVMMIGWALGQCVGLIRYR
jgi:O-antigen/teichoic acid export membrane protein